MGCHPLPTINVNLFNQCQLPTHLLEIHSPLPQANLRRSWLQSCCLSLHNSGTSSSPARQSACPSHVHREGIHLGHVTSAKVRTGAGICCLLSVLQAAELVRRAGGAGEWRRDVRGKVVVRPAEVVVLVTPVHAVVLPVALPGGGDAVIVVAAQPVGARALGPAVRLVTGQAIVTSVRR